MKKEVYTYWVGNNKGVDKRGTITKENYELAMSTLPKDKFYKTWTTNLKESTLIGNYFRKNGYVIMLWKEIFN